MWLGLVEFEIDQGEDPVTKYKTLKAAVQDVGWDPRSLPLWDSFFALFVMLHNSTVKSLATPQTAVSSTAPLGQLEASTMGYQERTDAHVTDDLSRFFTSADKVDIAAIQPPVSLVEALLKHPLHDNVRIERRLKIEIQQVMDLSVCDVAEERLKELSSRGDLNFGVFQNHLVEVRFIGR